MDNKQVQKLVLEYLDRHGPTPSDLLKQHVDQNYRETVNFGRSLLSPEFANCMTEMLTFGAVRVTAERPVRTFAATTLGNRALAK